MENDIYVNSALSWNKFSVLILLFEKQNKVENRNNDNEHKK